MEVPFGASMRKLFLFANDWTNLNHGSFGAIPQPVETCLREKQRLLEAAPDPFIRFDYGGLLLSSRMAIAGLIRSPVSSVVLIPNATTGVDTVLRNIEYTPSDHIVYFDTVYGSCERTTVHISETTKAKIVRIPLKLPLSHADIVSLFVDTVERVHQNGGIVRIAVFDVISYQPAIRMPFEALTAVCRKLNILSCVDGAHSVGQLDMDLPSLDPDFYISDLHKWLFVPRGSAILYAPPRTQNLLRTTFPTSWGFVPRATDKSLGGSFKQGDNRQSAFESLFESFGTMDYSPFLCIPAALEFRRSICGGEAAILRHNSGLAHRGGHMVARMLGTEVLDNKEGTLTKDCSMSNVRLPLDLSRVYEDLNLVMEDIAKRITAYRTFVPVYEHAGQVWVRISAQIYLDEDDFVFLGHVLREVCTEVMQERPAVDNGHSLEGMEADQLHMSDRQTALPVS